MRRRINFIHSTIFTLLISFKNFIDNLIICRIISHFIVHFCSFYLCVLCVFYAVFYLLPFGIINDDVKRILCFLYGDKLMTCDS